jgi:hypothetical protein
VVSLNHLSILLVSAINSSFLVMPSDEFIDEFIDEALGMLSTNDNWLL